MELFMMVLRFIALFTLMTSYSPTSPRETVSDRCIPSAHIADINTHNLTEMLTMLSWLNHEQAIEKLYDGLIFSTLSQKLEDANVENAMNCYAYFSSVSNFNKVAPYVKLNIFYATLYKRAQKLLTKQATQKQKALFKTLPKPQQFEQILSSRAGESIKCFHIPGAVSSMVKKAAATLTLSDALAFLYIGFLGDQLGSTKRYNGGGGADDDAYSILYAHAQTLCQTEGTKAQKTLFAGLLTPEEYAHAIK
jgi:hypothetical protein